MGLLAKLKSLFGEKLAPAACEMTEETYARFPFHLLSTDEPPFVEWQPPGSHVSSDLQQFWKGAVAQYQLFAFHVVNVSTWGHEFAERILGIQKRLLNEADPGWGDSHEAGIRKIYDVVVRAINAPMYVTGQHGEQLEVPIENRLAVELLVTSADSPFKTDRETIDRVGPPTFPNEEDWKLAIDLEKAKTKAMEHFQRSAKAVRFVAS